MTGTGYGATVSAQASYLNEVDTSATSTSYMLTFQETVGDTEVDLNKLMLNNEAVELLNTDAQAFVNKWGRYFISSYTTGCTLYAYVSLMTSSEMDMTQLNAELKESYSDGVFSASGSQSFSNTVKKSNYKSETSGQANVVGVAAPSTINPNTPESVYQYKTYVADNCKTGVIISVTLRNFLAAPNVINAITNSSAIDILSKNTDTTSQVTQYWNIVMQLQNLVSDIKKCAGDIYQCYSLQFVFDADKQEQALNQFYSNVSATLNDLLELGNSYEGESQIASDTSILINFQTQANAYANQFTAMNQNLTPISFSSVSATADGIESLKFIPQPVNVADGMNGVNNVYYNTSSKIVAYFRMNYGVDKSSGKSYLVLRAECLNGNLAEMCYSLEDVQSSSDRSLILNAKTCGSNTAFQAKVSNNIPTNANAKGSKYGQSCLSNIKTEVVETFPSAGSSQFCKWSKSEAPYYVDGTAPACNGSCGHNWNCGNTSSGNSCVSGHKKKCIHKNDIST